MAMNVVEMDLLSVTEGFIAHQVNCHGVMGAGVAKLIREKYPLAYDLYSLWCSRNSPDSLLGACQIVPVNDKLDVVNLFGQKDTGLERSTNYFAVAESLSRFGDYIWNKRNIGDLCFSDIPTFHVPYMMGCGLGGGNWFVYSEILHDWSDKTGINVTVCKLPE